MSRTLRLVPPDSRWPELFAHEAEQLRAVLGAVARDVQHIGSTAVPGLLSKPVVDVAVAVASEPDADACVAPIVALGYRYRGLNGEDVRRRYYVRDTNGVRTWQLHLHILPTPAWDALITFRDALRADPALASAYAQEKLRVAELVQWDKAAYSLAKGAFIARVLAAAATTPSGSG